MRQISYRKKQSVSNHRKVISINERGEDKQCKTFVHKGFVYIVRRVDHMEPVCSAPDVAIRKVFDTKRLIEKFSFRVKGSFYIVRDPYILQVDFCHTLRIDIIWKKKNFSPKKSVSL